MSFFSDLFSGNFSAAKHDIDASVAKLPLWTQNIVKTMESDAGQLLDTAVQVGAADVLASIAANGGVPTSAMFSVAAKDIEAKMIAQGQTFGTQLIYSALNGAVAAKTPSQGV